MRRPRGQPSRHGRGQMQLQMRRMPPLSVGMNPIPALHAPRSNACAASVVKRRAAGQPARARAAAAAATAAMAGRALRRSVYFKRSCQELWCMTEVKVPLITLRHVATSALFRCGL